MFHLVGDLKREPLPNDDHPGLVVLFVHRLLDEPCSTLCDEQYKSTRVRMGSITTARRGYGGVGTEEGGGRSEARVARGLEGTDLSGMKEGRGGTMGVEDSGIGKHRVRQAGNANARPSALTS